MDASGQLYVYVQPYIGPASGWFAGESRTAHGAYGSATVSANLYGMQLKGLSSVEGQSICSAAWPL